MSFSGILVLAFVAEEQLNKLCGFTPGWSSLRALARQAAAWSSARRCSTLRPCHRRSAPMFSLIFGGHTVTVTVLLLLPTPVRLVCLRSLFCLATPLENYEGACRCSVGLPTCALACCLRCLPRLPAGAGCRGGKAASVRGGAAAASVAVSAQCTAEQRPQKNQETICCTLLGPSVHHCTPAAEAALGCTAVSRCCDCDAGASGALLLLVKSCNLMWSTSC